MIVTRRTKRRRDSGSPACARGQAGAAGRSGPRARRSAARVLFVGRACCEKRVRVGSSTDSTGTPTTEHQSVQSSGTAAVVILPILPDRDRFGALTTIG